MSFTAHNYNAFAVILNAIIVTALPNSYLTVTEATPMNYNDRKGHAPSCW